jgi:hypothetical protein
MTRQLHPLFFIAVLMVNAGGPSAVAASGTPLDQDPHVSTRNARVIRLSNGSGKERLVATVANGVVYKSEDDGATFAKLATIGFQPGTTWKCCGTLYEVPREVGNLSAGTLLYAASFCAGRSASIDVYSSLDGGKDWRYLSTPVRRGECTPHRGLWEPQFEVSGEGALVMFWSDETDPCCSQKLAQIHSADGVTWKDEKNTVASNIERDRPGMAWVTRTPAGIYFMTYELCGPAQCTVFSRTSRDGWNYGPPANTGEKIETLAGEYFEHAPTNTSLTKTGSGDTTLLVVGQMLYERNGNVSPKNGQVLFINHTSDGSGPWETIPAPVKVPDARNNPCSNYSSVLLPVKGGSALLEMASDFNRVRTCVDYHAIEPLQGEQR